MNGRTKRDQKGLLELSFKNKFNSIECYYQNFGIPYLFTQYILLQEKLLFQKNHSNKIDITYFDIIKCICFLQNTSKY